MRLLPKLPGDLQRFEVEVSPPRHFIADLMQLPVMTSAERDSELVADFEAERSGLRKAKMMRVTGLPPADEAGLRGHKSQMSLVA